MNNGPVLPLLSEENQSIFNKLNQHIKGEKIVFVITSLRMRVNLSLLVFNLW